jgi:hypothetical protein
LKYIFPAGCISTPGKDLNSSDLSLSYIPYSIEYFIQSP